MYISIQFNIACQSICKQFDKTDTKSFLWIQLYFNYECLSIGYFVLQNISLYGNNGIVFARLKYHNY